MIKKTNMAELYSKRNLAITFNHCQQTREEKEPEQKKLKIVDVSEYITSEDNEDEFLILKTVFGLKEDVTQHVKQCQSKFPDHQTNMYYVRRILEDNLDDEEDVPDKDKLEEVLERSGFSTKKTSELSQWLRRIDLFENQRLFYWVERYLDFLNDTLHTAPLYPFEPQKIEVQFEHQDPWSTGEQSNNNNGRNITIINLRNKESNFLQENEKCLHITTPCKDGFWYHGTNHKGANSILKDGIKLGDGNKKQDFSDGRGFYLTPNFKHAKHYALENGHSDGAVLAFKYEFNTNNNGLDLTGETNKEEWRCVVKFCRNGKATSGLRGYKKAEYVYGRMSNYKRKASHPTEHKDFTTPQLCIKKEKLAIAVRYALKEIYFFPSTIKKK